MHNSDTMNNNSTNSNLEPHPSPIPSASVNTLNTSAVTSVDRTEFVDHPTMVYTTIILVGALTIIVLILWIVQWRRKKTGFNDFFRITGRPKNLFHYISSTFTKHILEYSLFVAVPLLIGMTFKISLLSLLSLWGFLITTIGAFYAARADFSSSHAFTQASKSYEEAQKTYLAVVNFADNLESFIEIVKHDLEKIREDVNIKFLTVIPAFGTVGLQEYYASMNRLVDYKEFHEYLAERISLGNSKLDLLTHDGDQTVDWIFNVLSATKNTNHPTPANTQVILEETKTLYQDQKKYVQSLIGKWGINKVDWRIWDTSKIPNLNGQDPISIPFQFLIVQHGSNQKVYFLFSGSYLYDFVFKSVNIPVDMSSLVTLTKGYFVERDKQLINIFINIFDSLYSPMDSIVYKDLDTHYPSLIEITSNNQTYQISI